MRRTGRADAPADSPSAPTEAGATSADVTVVYLGGFGRSGSTLIERVLGQVPGMVAVGELVHLVDRGLIGNEDCGCGRPFHSCPFWSDVGAKAFGGWDSVDGAAWLALKHRVDRNRYIPLLVAPVVPRFRRDLDLYARRLGQLYEAIAEVSGATVVVDASKHASTAFLLRRVERIRPVVVHLVRDSRGVAFSWSKEVTRPEVRSTPTPMPRFRPFGAAVRWLSYNAWFHVVARTGTTVIPLRYERFLAAPAAEVCRVAAVAGRAVDPASLGFLTDGAVDLAVDHSVAGNPVRFTTGRVALRPDDAWRRELTPWRRRVVTAVTAPLLACYGYLSRPRRG